MRPFSGSSRKAAFSTGARTVLMLVVSGCVLLVGAVLLGTRLGLLSLLLVLVVLLVGTVCFTAIGFIAANLSRDESNVNMISNLIGFPMLFTSETFYSLAHAPKWVVVIGKLQPFHYLVEAMRIAVSPGEAVSALWLPLGILLGFTVVCVALAVFTFRWDSERPGKRKKQKTRMTAAT
ncbi:ABC transporter permease [Paenibacillus sp. FSL M7-1455]|uniref:ABC transporter permease n=1 Tax=Paenibacillus sp. FSL M7-1455 TaxID=2975316 RepID=UPI0030F8866A